MAEYIDKQTVIDTLDAVCDRECQYSKAQRNVMCGACSLGGAFDAVEELPAADVQPVRRKPIKEFEGLYWISSDGVVTNQNGEQLKQGIKVGYGTCYKRVCLYKDGRYYTKYVHRLLAEAFIPNPLNLPMVNHKDEDGTNNRLDNLEWCSAKYNTNYGTAKIRMAEKMRGKQHTDEHNAKISDSLYHYYSSDEKYSRKVICLETGIVYQSMGAAARACGMSTQGVRMSCKRNSVKGRNFTFRFYDSPNCEAKMDGGETND